MTYSFIEKMGNHQYGSFSKSKQWFMGYPCEICNSTKRSALDHCHTHGWIRGILCHVCNVRMGLVDKLSSSYSDKTEYLEYYHNCRECGPWVPRLTKDVDYSLIVRNFFITERLDRDNNTFVFPVHISRLTVITKTSMRTKEELIEDSDVRIMQLEATRENDFNLFADPLFQVKEIYDEVG